VDLFVRRVGAIKSKATAACFDKAEPAATVRSRAAGSQDESRCGAIHKFKSDGTCNVNCVQVKLAGMRTKSKTPIRRLAFPGARDKVSVNAAADNMGDSIRRSHTDLHRGVTWIGTDGLLPRAEGYGKLGEVEHVYISLHSRDLLRSDDSVRRV
jgi:hypothetical protein